MKATVSLFFVLMSCAQSEDLPKSVLDLELAIKSIGPEHVFPQGAPIPIEISIKNCSPHPCVVPWDIMPFLKISVLDKHGNEMPFLTALPSAHFDSIPVSILMPGDVLSLRLNLLEFFPQERHLEPAKRKYPLKLDLPKGDYSVSGVFSYPAFEILATLTHFENSIPLAGRYRPFIQLADELPAAPVEIESKGTCAIHIK